MSLGPTKCLKQHNFGIGLSILFHYYVPFFASYLTVYISLTPFFRGHPAPRCCNSGHLIHSRKRGAHDEDIRRQISIVNCSQQSFETPSHTPVDSSARKRVEWRVLPRSPSGIFLVDRARVYLCMQSVVGKRI